MQDLVDIAGQERVYLDPLLAEQVLASSRDGAAKQYLDRGIAQLPALVAQRQIFGAPDGWSISALSAAEQQKGFGGLEEGRSFGGKAVWRFS